MKNKLEVMWCCVHAECAFISDSAELVEAHQEISHTKEDILKFSRNILKNVIK